MRRNTQNYRGGQSGSYRGRGGYVRRYAVCSCWPRHCFFNSLLRSCRGGSDQLPINPGKPDCHNYMRDGMCSVFVCFLLNLASFAMLTSMTSSSFKISRISLSLLRKQTRNITRTTHRPLQLRHELQVQSRPRATAPTSRATRTGTRALTTHTRAGPLRRTARQRT